MASDSRRWYGRNRPAPRNEQALVKKRMEMVFLLFLGSVGVLSLRLADLQGLRSRGFVELADRMQTRIRLVDAPRGQIQDRHGRPIARDILGKSICLNPRLIADPAATAAKLAEIIRLDEKQRDLIAEKISKLKEKHSAYAQLRRSVDRRLAEKAMELAKTDPALNGLWLEDSPVRVCPGGSDGIQLIGEVDRDRKGLEGAELRFNSSLGGKDGKVRVRVSATGAPIPESEIPIEETENGRDLRLTIDRDIQHFVEAELAKVAESETPDAATAMVMNAHTGEILGMANWPTYRPEDKEITPAQRRNRAITDLFEPGSIFKVITAAAALEYGVDTHVYCSGTRTIGNRSIHCAHGAAHGQCDLRRMIEQSCNIAAGTIAERIGPQRMHEFLTRMGFQSKTGIEFPGEETGRLERPDTWRTMRTVNIGFGQGVQASPIQILAAYAAIANDGIYNPPRLVLSAPGAKLADRKPHRVMTAANAATLRSCMESVVSNGTGKNAKIAGYSVGGKTGTAQMVINRVYAHGAYVASFVGFTPVTKPELAILVSVWHPRAHQYGGVVSAPVWREIARQSVNFLRIPPDAPEDLRDGRDVIRTYAKYASTHPEAAKGNQND